MTHAKYELPQSKTLYKLWVEQRNNCSLLAITSRLYCYQFMPIRACCHFAMISRVWVQEGLNCSLKKDTTQWNPSTFNFKHSKDQALKISSLQFAHLYNIHRNVLRWQENKVELYLSVFSQDFLPMSESSSNWFLQKPFLFHIQCYQMLWIAAKYK